MTRTLIIGDKNYSSTVIGHKRGLIRALRTFGQSRVHLQHEVHGIEPVAHRNGGLRDPQSIIEGRKALLGLFGGKIPLRRAKRKPGERPCLVARVGLNRAVLLEAAASAAGYVKSGSGGGI